MKDLKRVAELVYQSCKSLEIRDKILLEQIARDKIIKQALPPTEEEELRIEIESKYKDWGDAREEGVK